MAVRDEYITCVDGDQLDDGFFNGIQKYIRPQETYVGTAFNTSQSNAGTDSDDHELTAISTADLENAQKLLIRVLATHAGISFDNSPSSTTLKFQTKNVGSAYADSMAAQTVSYVDTGSLSSGDSVGVTKVATTEWVHTLTTDEKADGVQVKILSTSVCGDTGCAASVTNIQTTLWLLDPA